MYFPLQYYDVFLNTVYVYILSDYRGKVLVWMTRDSAFDWRLEPLDRLKGPPTLVTYCATGAVPWGVKWPGRDPNH